jgi:hypothetical protein
LEIFSMTDAPLLQMQPPHAADALRPDGLFQPSRAARRTRSPAAAVADGAKAVSAFSMTQIRAHPAAAAAAGLSMGALLGALASHSIRTCRAGG